jgi:hypothetical protein
MQQRDKYRNPIRNLPIYRFLTEYVADNTLQRSTYCYPNLQFDSKQADML